MFQSKCDKHFQQSHFSTLDTLLPFSALLCTFWMFFHFIRHKVYLCFCGSFFCFGPNLLNLKEIFVYLSQITLFTKAYCVFSVLHLSFLTVVAHCREKPAHTHFHTEILSQLIFSDACAWSFLHCFHVDMVFLQWYELHWKCIIVAQ